MLSYQEVVLSHIDDYILGTRFELDILSLMAQIKQNFSPVHTSEINSSILLNTI